MTNWTPKEYQKKVLDFAMSRNRMNIHMSPGMGKTSTLLTMLLAKDTFEDVFPALIVGPLRVVNSVWEREVEKWTHTRGLKVAKIVGPRPVREKAVKEIADIYVINYDNLPWLHEHLKVWPFKTIACDESTRIKNHRCSLQTSSLGKVFLRADGSVQAASVVRRSMSIPHFINLTGTPAPNGLKDLWGQQFPVDYGAALGKSFSAFQDRWFRLKFGSDVMHGNIEPLAGAEDEILARIAPTTISIDAYDWFDVDRPLEHDLPVQLPPKARKLYDTLQQEAVAELENEAEITAVNAGVVMGKCLQVASGHVFDDEGNAQHIHNAKLDMLASLVEELNGAPLLVTYQYTSDRDAILKRFKSAELLPTGAKQKEVEDRWNAGKIPMLVVHPASAGHGLSLQWGGHNICFYTPTWDLELYEQVIERIGPVRQAQAGFNRIVNVYRIKAENTFDEMVLGRTATKATVQQAIREYLNQLGPTL